MGSNDRRTRIIETVTELQADFWRISDAIWGFAELGLEEVRSARLLSDTLEDASFSIERGVAGMPTAFVATWTGGAGRPVIGLTAEYDALPALSQTSGVPKKDPLIPGAPGHGCGHNCMAATQALAAVALKNTFAESGVDVTLKFFGCPAEELGVSRPHMIRAGLFKDVDAIIDSHADSLFKTTYGMLGTALHSAEFTFEGRSSHAAWKPWMGRSASDAVELMHAGTERMREHVPPTTRIHWVTTFAGDAPNVVPDRAVTWYFIRDLDENIRAVTDWVYACADGAGRMTQTRFTTRVLAAIHQRFYNRALAELIYENIKAVGRPHYTNEEEAFALAMQREAGSAPTGLDFPLRLVDAEQDELRASSSDVGDVCLVAPTGQISIPVWVPGTPAHNWTAAAVGATSIAHKGISAAAKVIALTVHDLLTHPHHLDTIRTEFADLRDRRPYHPFLPDDAEPPHGFYREIMSRYRKDLEAVGDQAIAGAKRPR